MRTRRLFSARLTPPQTGHGDGRVQPACSVSTEQCCAPGADGGDRSCHSKCISSRYAEAELNRGESVCVDRCVAKFFEVNKRVGERMQAAGANAAATGGGAASFGGM